MSTAGNVPLCPVSGTKGKPVKVETLRSLIRAEDQHRIGAGPYFYCDAQDCDVVYFAQDGSHIFAKTALRVRVGVKETEPPRPICYCFGHTVEEVWDQIRRTGRSTVLEAIRLRIQTEGCDCEHTNPQGACCLGVVTRFVQEGLRLYAGTVPQVQPGAGDCCNPVAETEDSGCCGSRRSSILPPGGT